MSAMESPWLLTPINVLYQAIAHPLLLVIYGILISLYWIASPLVYLGHFLVQAGSLPIHFLAKLETLYIFFGVAVIVGLTTGPILYFLSKTSMHILGFDVQPSTRQKKAQGHTAASYRASRERRKKLDKHLSNAAQARMQALDPLVRDALQHSPGARTAMPQSPNTPKRRDSLLSTTILEEVEDSDGDFDF